MDEGPVSLDADVHCQPREKQQSQPLFWCPISDSTSLDREDSAFPQGLVVALVSPGLVSSACCFKGSWTTAVLLVGSLYCAQALGNRQEKSSPLDKRQAGFLLDLAVWKREF